MSAALIVFAKPPALAKRRLAADLGRQAATRIAAALLDDALARGAASALTPSYFYWMGPPTDAEALRAKGLGYRIAAQTGAGLGERMQHAFGKVLARSDAALLIGTDCPDFDAAGLAQATELLRANDAAFVPAHDGGYVAIGLTRYALPALATIFRGITWGTGDVAEHTRTRLRRAGFAVGEMPPLADVDDARDLDHAAKRHPFLAAALRDSAPIRRAYPERRK